MYFSSRRYPEFRGVSRREQDQIVRAALQAFDPSSGKRFIVGLLTSWVLGILTACWLDSLLSAAHNAIASGLVTGIVFWSYLLWEINGRYRAAVLQHLAERGDRPCH